MLTLPHNFWTITDRAFIFHIYFPLDEAKIFAPVTFTVTFDLHIWKFNICHNFRTIRGRAFILHMYIPCREVFPVIPKVLILWPWTWILTYISGNSHIRRNFWTIGLLYFTCTFLVLRSFRSYQKFWPLLWPLTFISENFYICRNFLTIKGRVLIFHKYIPCNGPFSSYQKISPCDLWHTYLKTLTFAITFYPLEEGLSYLTCTFLMMRHFCSY